MKQHIAQSRLLTSHRSRHGFAMPFMMLMLMVLFTFLIAAQGTVLGSAKMVKRSAVRADEANATAGALGHVLTLAPSAISTSGQAAVALPGGIGETVNCTAGVLAEGDSLYGRQRGISHRAGDVLVRVSLSQNDSKEAREFLLNNAGARGGVIGL